MPKSPASRLVPFVEWLLGGPLPVGLRTWDGVRTAPPNAPTVLLRNRRALRRLLYAPGESGKPLPEKGLRRSRPGYAAYVERTSGFFPLPPRRVTPR